MEDAKQPLHDTDQDGNHVNMNGAYESVARVLKNMTSEIFLGRGETSTSQSFAQRTKTVILNKAPILRDSLRDSSIDIVHWMHRGGSWRAFLVISVGLILLLALTGLSAFIIFFVIATANAVAIGFLVSLASVGSFMALFFSSLLAIYIGALVVAVFTILIITFLTICAALTSAGWIAFLWVIWQCGKKTVHVLQGSIAMTASALASVAAAGSTQTMAIENRLY